MKNKLLTRLLIPIALYLCADSAFAQTNIETHIPLKPAYLKTFPKRSAAGNTAVSVSFGIKGLDEDDCAPGAGICSAEAGSHIIDGEEATIFGAMYGVLVLYLDMKSLDYEGEQSFYQLLEQNRNLGIIFLGGSFGLNSEICSQMGVNGPVTVTTSTPIQVNEDPNYEGDSTHLMLSFMGAIPGHSSNISFGTCAGNCNCSLNITPLTENSKNPAYSSYVPGSGSGELTVYMNVNKIISQQPQNKKYFPVRNDSVTATYFKLSKNFVFDRDAAASMSVPEGWQIKAGSYGMAPCNKGWFFINFTVTP